MRHFANPPERNSHGKGAALALAQTALVAYGRIDVWVNDAGVGADGVVKLALAKVLPKVSDGPPRSLSLRRSASP